MSYYLQKNKSTIIKRHFFLLLFTILKFSLSLLVSFLLFFILYYYSGSISDSSLRYIIFLLGFGILNYAFLNLVLNIIEYYNNLIIICDDRIIVIKSSFIMKDDIEIIDSRKIVKVDKYCHGIISNIFNYGNIVIEQQQQETRTFHFIPSPTKFIQIYHAQREAIRYNKQENIGEKES